MAGNNNGNNQKGGPDSGNNNGNCIGMVLNQLSVFCQIFVFFHALVQRSFGREVEAIVYIIGYRGSVTECFDLKITHRLLVKDRLSSESRFEQHWT